MWLSVDPLANYNPIFESEHYIDGEHNGGFYNSGNLNPYSYTYQNPVVFVDPNGKQAFFMHGTWGNQQFMSDASQGAIQKTFGNSKKYTERWSGSNSMQARRTAAREQFNFIINHRIEGEPISIVGHSHGGNVGVMAANMVDAYYEGKVPINLITINTPVREEYQLDTSNTSTTHYNIYNSQDVVQVSGGTDTSGKGKLGLAGRTYPNATNIQYKDQVSIFQDVGCGLSGHCGTSKENVKVWLPKLQQAINVKQKTQE
ncbi:hypothetical protein GNY06_06545 [Elizabethkingia argentiflava]|uniref:Fungal lipase-type domain-containing protein n=1 Tax=Elizabethkingia argenteiflava TaxID=2681556 RepID=A0A845PS49_9FLAO|nr:hypothetical protein [Elizabethkingia argenteiflava]NAW51042.1 hypothetical protein [Elizabethkingia argenteiflava]